MSPRKGLSARPTTTYRTPHLFRSSPWGGADRVRNVSIKYHIVAHAAQQYAFPAEQIRAAFASSGIDMVLSEGDPIDADPAHNPVTNYDALIKRYSATDINAGHLIIGLDD